MSNVQPHNYTFKAQRGLYFAVFLVCKDIELLEIGELGYYFLLFRYSVSIEVSYHTTLKVKRFL